jgi:hypothetical protein
MIRSLLLPLRETAPRDTKHWHFAGIRRLALTPKIAEAPRLFNAAIGCCGPLLEEVTISFCAELPVFAAGCQHGGYHRPSDAHLRPDESTDRKPYFLHPSVLTAVARRRGLCALRMRAYVAGSAIQQLRAAIPAPFAALTVFNSCVSVDHWPALVDMLVEAGTVTDLILLVGPSAADGGQFFAPAAKTELINAGLHATARQLQRQLRRLALVFHRERIQPGADITTGMEVVYGDFSVLGALSELTALAIYGGYFGFSESEWHRFLCGRPRLQ